MRRVICASDFFKETAMKGAKYARLVKRIVCGFLLAFARYCAGMTAYTTYLLWE